MLGLLLTAAPAAPLPTRTTYEPGNGFRIESTDGQFSIAFQSRIQVLQTVQQTASEPALQGLELRRLRLDFSGHGFGDWNTWRIQVALADRDVNLDQDNGPTLPAVVDAYWEARPHDQLAIRVGQYKIPFSRRRISSTSTLMFVDRDLVDGELGLDRDRGAQVTGWIPHPRNDLPALRAYVGVYQGNGRDPGLQEEWGVLPMVRVEAFPLGGFDYYTESDLQRSRRVLFGFGGAVGHHWSAPRSRGITGQLYEDGGTADNLIWTADLSARWRGVSLDALVNERRSKRSGVDDPIDVARSTRGWSVQAGTMLPRLPVHVAGRVSHLSPIGDSAQEPGHALGGAVSWFVHGHPFDLTTDLFQVTHDGVSTLRWRLQVEVSL